MIRSNFDVITSWLPVYWRHCVAVFAVASITAWTGTRPSVFVPPNNSAGIENEIDQALSNAASNALNEREGTIIVVDPQTGRVRAIVNPKIAFESSYAPGSTIKPFTALAALRAGLIDKNSKALCRKHYSRQGFETVCAHPRDLPPFDPSAAIAYSCNYYFGRLGEHLNEELLSDVLNSFGFGKRTLINGGTDDEGQLLRGKVDPRNALGEGDHLQATPIQLVMAYSALVNGGHLFTPAAEPVSEFKVHERAQLAIAPEHRSLIVAGMRGAVVYGTASHAGLNLATLNVFGKTGTSAPLKGFRSQGWFVGFATDSSDSMTPDHIRLAVLVFLKRGHGADAAQVSQTIFEEFARWKDQAGAASPRSAVAAMTSERGHLGWIRSWAVNLWPAFYKYSVSVAPGAGRIRRPVAQSPSLDVRDTPPANSSDVHAKELGRIVRVHLVREDVTKEMPLEDYVAAVVATEGSMEDQPEALKALAVAVRTYALKNLGRHTKDGYDFCTTTHCQRYQSAIEPTVRTNSRTQAETEMRAVAAVRDTAGEVLRDERAVLVDSYFSASCGGMTANMQTLWGGSGSAYLRGVPDEACAAMPHHTWTDVISTAQLLQALQSDERTNPGARLNGVTIARHDATGRAELIVIEGERRHIVRGWDFKIIVGRKLGWNLLKSSRFEIMRSGANFIFRGSGFGHGLGLCQEGAHVMAQRGANYEQILGKYFPGTNVAPASRDRVAELSLGNQRYCAIATCREEAASPQHSAVRLRLTERASTLFSEATPRTGGVASKSFESCPERQSLSALCGGQAAKGNDVAPTFADLLWEGVGTGSRSDRVSWNPSTTLRFSSSSSNKRTSLSSEHFRVNYPVSISQRDAEQILGTLESMRANLVQRISAAGLALDQFPAPEVFINASTGDFVGRTGQPWWAAAASRGNLIELQPVEVLKRRGVLETTLKHELVHTVVDKLSRGRSPRWLAEGLALYCAGEGPMVSRYGGRGKTSVEDLDARLAKAATADEMRKAYAAAYRKVSALVKTAGEASVWQRVAQGL